MGVELHNLAVVALGRGDIARSTDLLIESLAVSREAGDLWCVGLSLRFQGDLAIRIGRPDAAAESFTESLAIGQQRGDLWGIADSLSGLAGVAIALEDPTLAARLLGAAESIYESVGIGLPPPDRPHYGRLEPAIRDALGSAAYDREWEDGKHWPLAEILPIIDHFASFETRQPRAKVLASSAIGIAYNSLTEREQQVLQLMTKGKSNREIAEVLFLSHRTVSWHVSNILNKLGVESRTAAAVRAAQSEHFEA